MNNQRDVGNVPVGRQQAAERCAKVRAYNYCSAERKNNYKQKRCKLKTELTKFGTRLAVSILIPPKRQLWLKGCNHLSTFRLYLFEHLKVCYTIKLQPANFDGCCYSPGAQM